MSQEVSGRPRASLEAVGGLSPCSDGSLPGGLPGSGRLKADLQFDPYNRNTRGMTTTPAETTDDELAARVRAKQAGSREAYEQLYRRHGPLLLAFLRARVGAEADDLHQEVWVRVWERPHLFHGGNFRAWVHTIARNSMTDRARKTKPTQLAESDDVTVRHTPVLEILGREEKVQFQLCLQKLPGRHREVVDKVLAGVDYEELCQEMGLSKGTAYKLFCEAKQRLAECVQRASP